MRIFFIIATICLCSRANSLCDTSYERLKVYYEKQRELEVDIVQDLGERADSILSVRVIDAKYSDSEKIYQTLRIKVVEPFKGSYKSDEIITKYIYEEDEFETTVCGDPNPRELRFVSSMKPRFKYLIYLRDDKIIRANQYREWPESLDPGTELKIIQYDQNMSNT